MSILDESNIEYEWNKDSRPNYNGIKFAITNLEDWNIKKEAIIKMISEAHTVSI